MDWMHCFEKSSRSGESKAGEQEKRLTGGGSLEFKRLMPEHFGKLHKREILLKPGINVIYGENESGKTTLHTFIRGMLFGIERARGRAAKEDPYVRYQPWETPGTYQGSLELEQKGITYHISRSFYLKEKSFKVTRQDTGRELQLPDGRIDQLIPNLTEANFKNTISMEQKKAKTDTELAQEVQNYIANLSTARSNEVDVAHAVDKLMRKKKRLGAEELEIRRQELSMAAEEGRRRLNYMDGIGERKQKLQQQIERLERQTSEVFREKEKLSQQLEKVNILQTQFKEYEISEQQLQKLQERKNIIQIRLRNTEEGKERCQWLQQCAKKTEELLRRSTELRVQLEQASARQEDLEEESLAKKNMRRRLTIGIVIGGLLLLIAGIGKSAGIQGESGVDLLSVLLTLSGGASIFLACIIGMVGAFQNAERTRQKEREKKEQTEIEEEFERIIQAYQTLLKGCGAVSQEQLNQLYRQQIEENAQAVYWEEEEKQLLEEVEILQKKQTTQRSQLEIRWIELGNKEEKSIEQGNNIRSWEERLKDWLDIQLEQHKQRINELTKQLEQIEKQEQEVRIQKERMDWELSSYEQTEAELMEQESELVHLRQLISENEEELAAITLAIETLKDLSVDIHDSFGQKLNQMVSRLAAQITNGTYETAVLNEKLEVKILHGSEYVSLQSLSAGTIEQIYLALRLSVAELFFEKEPMPVLLDDALSLYDDGRARAVLRLLAELNRQVILFTCQHREEQLLEQEGIPFHFIQL